MSNLIIECLKKNKPNITQSSIKTYKSLLQSFYYKHNDKNKNVDCSFFENQDHILNLLKDKEPGSRKTILSALIAISDKNDKYKNQLLEDGKTYQDFILSQKKNKSQEENWKSFDEIKTIYEDMYNKIKPILNSKNKLNIKDYVKLNDFIIVCLTSGIFISPRRSMDWIEMKIKGDIDKEKDNYIDKNYFVFNKYKTSKFYNQQKVEIPKNLKTILNKFIKLNPYNYLLTDNQGKQLSNIRLNQKLNSIFDGKISTSLLRHIYITDKFKNAPSLLELQKNADEMGNSILEQLQYIKK